MLKFIAYLFEEATNKHVIFSFGRMNPPTTGHEVLVNKVKQLAKKHSAHHEIVLSHSRDPKKNPLTPEQKVMHARRFFPNTNISAATPDEPTLIHHLSRLHKQGHDRATVVAGSDRVPEYKALIDRYNGKPDKKGVIPFNFKKIDVVSAGERDPDSEGASGMSASKMREFARANDYDSFKQGVPSHVIDQHARELFRDVKSGMKEENV